MSTGTTPKDSDVPKWTNKRMNSNKMVKPSTQAAYEKIRFGPPNMGISVTRRVHQITRMRHVQWLFARCNACIALLRSVA
jgi:hypothetical protein